MQNVDFPEPVGTPIIQVNGCLNLMSPAMNARRGHSLSVYIPEREGRIVIQASSFQERHCMFIPRARLEYVHTLYTFHASSYSAYVQLQ
jgi:hypothetical protein